MPEGSRERVAQALASGHKLYPERRLGRLRRALSGDRRWDFDDYATLRDLALRGAAPGAIPPFTFGDALLALRELSKVTPPWTARKNPSDDCKEKLGYRRISQGIARVRANNLEGWERHATACRRIIRQVAAQSSGDTAVVVGAGQAYDIPLVELAKRYRRLLVVDVDGAALRQTVERELSQAERRRVEVIEQDVTAVAEYFCQATKRIAREHQEEEPFRLALLELLRSYSAPSHEGLPAADVTFSVLVLTQLATPMLELLEARFRARFPESTALEQHAVQVAFGQFSQRVQQDHAMAVLRQEGLGVLISDVGECQTELSPDGTVRVRSGEFPLIGAPELSDLLPSYGVEHIAQAEWAWHRLMPRLGAQPGRLLRVQAVVSRAS